MTLFSMGKPAGGLTHGIVSAGLILLFAASTFGQPSEKSPEPNAADPMQAPQKLQEQIRRIQEQHAKIQGQQLKILEKTDPQAYAAYTQQQKIDEARTNRIRRLISDFHAGRLDEDAAKQKLYPLVKEQTKPIIDGMDRQIAALESQLATLKKQRGDPDAFIRQRVDALLGKGRDPMATPMPPHMMPPAP